jgi:hypothetical protein
VPSPPDTKAVSQADFDRLTAANRDDWRKWEARTLVTKPRGRYAWPHVLQALVLKRMETAAGIDTAVQCWDDIREDLLSGIHQETLDLVVDPGISAASRPRLRAHLSTDEETTARLARAAERPWVIELAPAIAAAREEFERATGRMAQPASPAAGAKRAAKADVRSIR